MKNRKLSDQYRLLTKCYKWRVFKLAYICFFRSIFRNLLAWIKRELTLPENGWQFWSDNCNGSTSLANHSKTIIRFSQLQFLHMCKLMVFASILVLSVFVVFLHHSKKYYFPFLKQKGCLWVSIFFSVSEP